MKPVRSVLASSENETRPVHHVKDDSARDAPEGQLKRPTLTSMRSGRYASCQKTVAPQVGQNSRTAAAEEPYLFSKSPGRVEKSSGMEVVDWALGVDGDGTFTSMLHRGINAQVWISNPEVSRHDLQAQVPARYWYREISSSEARSRLSGEGCCSALLCGGEAEGDGSRSHHFMDLGLEITEGEVVQYGRSRSE